LQLDVIKDVLKSEQKKNKQLQQKIDVIKVQISNLFKQIKYSKKIEIYIKQLCQLLDLNASTFFKQIK
jgi:hypothetical protein